MTIGNGAIGNGTRFDRYEILTHLGSGGMGEVYLARDSRLERKIAIKLLPAECTRDQARLLRFETEAKAASALNHPNIITIHEIGESESRHFITTEFIEGRTLRQIINGGKISPLAAIDIAAQIASALAAAHQAGIVHRDIKPENVMIRPDGIVKVLDFGLAKLTERVSSELELERPTAALVDTDPGMVLGTATYMSPEQARGLRVDARTDIFSLGIVLYEMLTGKPPFEGPTPADVISHVLNREARPLTSFINGLPMELQRIVSKALRKDREERYQTVKDLQLDLKSLKRELESTATLSYPIPTANNSGQNEASYETAALPNVSRPSQASGIYRAVPTEEYRSGEMQRGRRLLFWLLPLILALVAGIYFATSDKTHELDTIAVLPFTNSLSAPDAVALSDTITDGVINGLSNVPHLKVKSRNAVRQYKSGETDIVKVGNELGVHAVLTGSIIQEGEKLAINVALVDAKENNNLWGQRYNRKIADLKLIHQEIANDVSNQLRLKLTGEEKRRVDAYQAYQKGRNAWAKRTDASIQEAIKYHEEAIRLDPNFALAWAGLADCYNMQVNYSFRQPKEAFPKAKEAAEKALVLDERLAEAHAARAYIAFQWEWNWQEAEREFRRAIDLNSDYGPAYQWYSSLLAAIGQNEKALSIARRAKELEPFSPIITSHYGWICYLVRQYDQTIQETNQILKLEPEFFAAHRYLGLAYEHQGKYEQAIAEFQKTIPQSRGSILLKSELAHAYAVAGQREEATKILAELEQLSTQRPVSPFFPALIHVGLGNQDRAITLLNKAYDERAERMIWLRADSRFDSLRKDPRFIDLLQRLGLAQ